MCLLIGKLVVCSVFCVMKYVLYLCVLPLFQILMNKLQMTGMLT